MGDRRFLPLHCTFVNIGDVHLLSKNNVFRATLVNLVIFTALFFRYLLLYFVSSHQSLLPLYRPQSLKAYIKRLINLKA
jgi:hypothetical protein